MRGDLENLGYVMLSWLGKLPWAPQKSSKISLQQKDAVAKHKMSFFDVCYPVLFMMNFLEIALFSLVQTGTRRRFLVGKSSS